MILYFADRYLNILGQASARLPEGLTVSDDNKIEDIETGVASFECYLPYDRETREKVETSAEVGNFILRKNGEKNEFYTIIDSESDTKNQEVYVYAEDAGLDLLNEIVGAYEADQAYPISHYVNMYANDSGFEIGINEVSNLTRKLSWDGEATVTERLTSVATQFDGCEISYSFDIVGLDVKHKYINIHKERGKDIGIQLRLNKEIDRIITKKSIANLATALLCTGGTPEESEIPITLTGYSYDDGDFYVDSEGVLRSRKAVQKWGRVVGKNLSHIVRPYSYDTTNQETLCKRGITELKKLCEMEVNYEVEINELPDNVQIGDRVNVIDDAGNLYLSTRLLKIEESETQQTIKVTLGEFLLKSSGISQKVADLAAEFAKMSASAARALQIAQTAKTAATAAQTQANEALTGANNAQLAADNAKLSADEAKKSAEAAQLAADNAQSSVDNVEKSVDELGLTVEQAQAAADQAKQAAQTAETKATEAQQAAVNAQGDATEAKEAASTAQENADLAVEKAEGAQSTADTAKSEAEAAQTTAAAAKLDAEQAQKDVDTLGENLTTLEKTMSVDYARKTDLTETEARLQTQITQNADEISSTASKVQTIDETANNAAEQAQAAQTAAEAAQAQADQATADAEAAQTAADEAAQAAANAQSEADTAKEAANTAQSVADKAEADLAAAKADLATVTSRVDATEEEILAAQAAVDTAQAAADKAQADAEAAATEAEKAQSTANTAVTNAANAQAAADDASSKATIAQKAADEAKGDAAAAQATADEAKEAANAAQITANTAKTNAANAQATADSAAAEAAAAQQAADDADTKAAQAQTDLNTAKQNLADVTSRVDATEAEVEAAQADVIKAQQAADAANAEAEAAQATADEAKANAATAQTAADNAKLAADAAQNAADEAQAAADAAQKDVDNLAVRVTTAETKITQNSEKIELMATKTEVTETLGGYYRKEETESLIEQSSTEIKSTVRAEITEKINAVEIGGKNLVPVNKIDGVVNVVTTEEFELRDVWASTFITNSNLVEILEPATQYTARYNLELIERTTVPTKFDMMVGFLIYSAAHSTWISLATQMSENAEIGTTKTYEVTFTTPETWNDESLICYSRRWTTEGASPVGFDAFKVTDFKIEKGNKATDWTPAPEDTQDSINNVQNEANTANENTNERVAVAETTIQQLSDCISMLVIDENGESLMEQTENGWTFSMKTTNEAVSGLQSSLATLQQNTTDTQTSVSALQQAVKDYGETLEYVNITTYEDEPCIELGESDSDFKLLITNTRIMFMNGSNIPTYINTNGLVTQNIEVQGEIVQGGFVMLNTSDGGWGLLWKGVDS